MDPAEKHAEARTFAVSPEKLSEAAIKFRAAGAESDKIVSELEKALKELEESWKGTDQQEFYKYFAEWRTHMAGVTALLLLASRELDAIADNYAKADGDLVPRAQHK